MLVHLHTNMHTFIHTHLCIHACIHLHCHLLPLCISSSTDTHIHTHMHARTNTNTRKIHTYTTHMTTNTTKIYTDTHTPRNTEHMSNCMYTYILNTPWYQMQAFIDVDPREHSHPLFPFYVPGCKFYTCY